MRKLVSPFLPLLPPFLSPSLVFLIAATWAATGDRKPGENIVSARRALRECDVFFFFCSDIKHARIYLRLSIEIFMR